MFLFILNILFGLLCFSILKYLRQLLFLLFINRVLPKITEASNLKLFFLILFPLTIVTYFPFIMITILTVIFLTIINKIKNSPNEIESQPKKLILFFPAMILVFFLYYLHCILFCNHNFQYFLSFLFLADAFACAFYKIASQFLIIRQKDDFGFACAFYKTASQFNRQKDDFVGLLMDLPEMDNVLEIHKNVIFKYITHLDRFSDIKAMRPIQTIPEKIKVFYMKKLQNLDLVYVYYFEKLLLVVSLFLGLIFTTETNIIERSMTYVFSLFHIDWLCFKLEKHDLGDKKKFLKKVFLMMMFKFLLVLFAFNQAWFFVGYFIFFTSENLILHHSQKISTKKYVVHFISGLIFLILNKRIESKDDFLSYKAFELNVMVFLWNFFLMLIRLFQNFIKKTQNLSEIKYQLFSKKTFSLISEYFIQESTILISILMTFLFTFDLMLLIQLIYILGVWVLLRFIYENLKLNDFKLFGDPNKIKLKFKSFEKILTYSEIKSKEVKNLDSLNKEETQNLVGLLFNLKKHQKNILFHEFNKVGDFEKWIYGKFIPKILRTDERILLSGK